MASIRNRVRTDGTIAWSVLYRDRNESGITTQRTSTFDSEREAKEFRSWINTLGPAEAERINREREGISDAPTMTLGIFAEEYVSGLSGITQGTRDRYRSMISGALSPLAHYPIAAITPASVRAWVNSQDGKFSGKTIANRHGLLSAVMKAAVIDGHIPASPCEGTRIPKTERQEMVFLTGQEFSVLLDAVKVSGQDFVTLLPATGLRFSEASALQVRDIDLDARLLTVSRAFKYAERGPSPLGPPKSSRSRRTISIPVELVSLLRPLVEGKRADQFIFTNSAGKPWTRSRFHEGIWQPAVRAVEEELGKKPRVHDMRHTCAAWMLKAGVSLPVIQRHLGHENISTTVDRYGHLEPAHLAAAAGAISSQLVWALPEIES